MRIENLRMCHIMFPECRLYRISTKNIMAEKVLVSENQSNLLLNNSLCFFERSFLHIQGMGVLRFHLSLIMFYNRNANFKKFDFGY